MRKKTRIRLYAFLIVAITAGVYLNSREGKFVFDDEAVIEKNPFITRLWPPAEAFRAPPESPVRDRPMVSLTLSIDYALWGLNPRGYHLTNLAIHLLAALVLFGIVRRTLLFFTRFREKSAGIGLTVALIWAVHPLQTESVTYLTQRCESLMGLFYLLTLYSVIRGAAGGRRGWYGSAIISCALGMGTKAVMVTAPLAVLFYDRIFLAGSFRQIVNKRKGLYLGLSSTGLILAALLAVTSYEDIVTYGPLQYALSQPEAIGRYLRLSFFPYPLCLDYYWRPPAGFLSPLPALLFIFSLIILTVRELFRRPPLGFCGLWFFLILAPTSSFFPLEDPAFEHRIYLPLAGLIVLLVLGGYEIIFPPVRKSADRRLFGVGFTAGVILIFGILTVNRNADYHSPVGIWREVIRLRPQNPRARNNLANLLLERGERKEAERLYRNATEIDPDYHPAYYNLANLRAGEGNFHESIRLYRRALAIEPEAVEVHTNLGVALYQLGWKEEALEHYRRAITIDPDDPAAYYNLGLQLLREGEPARARSFLEKARRLRPDHPPIEEALNWIERISPSD